MNETKNGAQVEILLFDPILKFGSRSFWLRLFIWVFFSSTFITPLTQEAMAF